MRTYCAVNHVSGTKTHHNGHGGQQTIQIIEICFKSPIRATGKGLLV